MYTCAECGVVACRNHEHKNMPTNCPMHNEQIMQKVFAEYCENEDIGRFFIVSAEIEKMGYGKWTRLKEIIEFCKRMGYRKVGLAFCGGLHKEGKIISHILKNHGINVISTMCKTGGISKEKAGVQEEYKLKPHQFEPMCNPIAQANLLNEQNTEFNIVVGLCVGHDSLFYKYSNALVTTLIVKDRVLAHNPVGAVYCAESYYRKKLAPND